MRSVLAALAAFVALAAPAFAHDLGPAVGATAPPVAGQDQTGAPQTLATLAGPNGLVLVFTRSADWCPYCQRQLIGLEGVRGEIEARGWKLAAVTTDDIAKLARFARRRAIGYPLISDEESSVIAAYGLTDPQYGPRHRAHGVPVPTILFLTPDRQVAARLGDADYRVRPAPETVLATLDNIAR